MKIPPFCEMKDCKNTDIQPVVFGKFFAWICVNCWDFCEKNKDHLLFNRNNSGISYKNDK